LNAWGGSWGSSWGASWATVDPPAGGFRSFLGFWFGGASAPTDSPEPTPEIELLGGGAKDSDYLRRKRQIEELDRINENIRRDKEAAFKALTAVEVPKEVYLPNLDALRAQHEFNLLALMDEIIRLRAFLLAQQEADDETAFLMMLQ